MSASRRAAEAAEIDRPMGDVYKRLLVYLRPYLWPRFIFAVVCMVLYSATSGFMPFIVKSAFDDVFVEQRRWALDLLPVVVIAVFTFRGVVNFGHIYLMEWIGQRIIADVRNHLNRHFQGLSLAFFNRTPTGTLLSRMTNDVMLLRGALTDATASLMKDLSQLIVLVGVAFWMDWVLAVIAFIVFPVAVLPLQRLSRRLRRFTAKGQETLGGLAALLQESIQGNRIVKAFGMEAYEIKRFETESERVRRLAVKAARIKGFTTPVMEVLSSFGIAGVIWFGGASVFAGERTPGGFMAFITALVLLYDPFKGLTKTNNTIQQGLAAAGRVFDLLDTPSDVVDRPEAKPLEGFETSIRYEDVVFRYDVATGAETDASDDVLRGVSLELARGEAVALVGPSGGGKSTLADLLPRFYDVTGGRISIDGRDIRDLQVASLRSQIALVSQSTFLFNDTIRSNIAYGATGVSQERIEWAARAANAHEFITGLRDGYDTMTGELGVKLSGGQRQRVAIARALLKDAPILILDEATSALDTEAERHVQEAIERLMEGRTTLVIAHRLSTIRRANRIAFLRAGEIVELGTHEELLALDGNYRHLHDLQFQDEESGGSEAD